MDKKKVLSEGLQRLRSLSLAKDGAGSETYKNALKMSLTYDPGLKGVAVVDAQTGSGKVGDRFFGKLSPSDELSAKQAQIFNTWTDERRRLFVLRHEVEHMSAANRKLVSHYRMGNVAIESIPRHKLSFEIDATNKAFDWMMKP